MKIVCAPDSFKECLDAGAVAAAMAAGVRRADPGAVVDRCPVADGGEGTVAAIAGARRGEPRITRVCGPMGTQVEARWALCPDGLAVIEMAAASGLALLPESGRDAVAATTFGVGQLMLAALDAGATELLLGLGGSATTDGGCGMAQALGVRFLDRRGRAITEPFGGGRLRDIACIDVSGIDTRLASARVTAACDVSNPLTGPAGAAAVFSPQKGADRRQVRLLDDGLVHLAGLIRQDLGLEVADMPRAGAAGGLAAGLYAFVGCRLESGIELVLHAVDFDRRIRGADLCLTGEGRLDAQSLAGKACLGVAQAAVRHGVPAVALVGALDVDAETLAAAGFTGCIEIGRGLDRRESMRRARELLADAAAAVVAGWPRPG